MAIVADDFSPISVGDIGTPFATQFLHKDGSPVPLSGATITMTMEDIEGNVTTCSTTSPNNWVIDDATNGKAHRQWSASDVSLSGNFTLRITITIGGLPVTADAKQLEILPLT